MCVARYGAVFPISNLINFVSRARGGRHDEIPRSFQIVLFSAGLRGAVGVALAEGMKGAHAVALRTTVLVSVVLSVVVFGSTIQQVIEAVGIQTGVADEGDDSSDDEGYHDLEHARSPSFALGTPGASHHFASLQTAAAGPHRSTDVTAATPIVEPYTPRILRPFGGSSRTSSFSRLSGSPSASSDSDGEALPSATDSGETSLSAMGAGGVSQVWSTLDEQYLLPVFSNTTASRHSSRQKASLKAKRASYQERREEEEGGKR